MLLSYVVEMGIELGDECFQAVLRPLHVIKEVLEGIHGVELLLRLCVVRAYLGQLHELQIHQK